MDSLNYASIFEVCKNLFNKDIFEVYTIHLKVGDIVDQKLRIDGKHLRRFVDNARYCQIILESKIEIQVYDENNILKEHHVFE